MRPDELLPPPSSPTEPVLICPGNEDAPRAELSSPGRPRFDDPADLDPGVRPGLLVPVGPWGSVGTAVGWLEDLAVRWIVVLSSEPANDAALERAVAHLAAYGLEVEEVADLDAAPWRAGVRLRALEQPPEPAEASAAARAELERRRTGDLAGRGAPPEVLRRRLRAAERARSRETERAATMEAQLREATRELALEQRRLDRLERSTSYRIGEAVVQGLRDPASIPRRFRELVVRWRRRGPAPTRTEPSGTVEAPPPPPAPATLTVARTAVPTAARTVAGVVTDRTAAGLADEVALTRLLPNDAAALVRSLEPSTVIIESEACLPGEAWSGTGSGAVPGRDAALWELLDAADRVGAATVLVWTGERWRAPGLAPIAARCTLEVAADEDGFGWTFGVPTHRIHAGRRAAEPSAGVGSLELRGTRHLPAALADEVVRYRGGLGGVEVTDPWGLWSRHRAWVAPADGPDRWHADAAVVAGARAVDPAVGDPGDGGLPDWRQQAEVIHCRGLHATLRDLGELLGRELLPATARSVALVLVGGDARHLDTALAQRDLPPGSVLVAAGDLDDRARGAAQAAGLRVTRHLPSDVRFVVPLDADRHGIEHLRSLLAGWELARTPVVGVADASGVRAATLSDVDPRDTLVERAVAAAHGLPTAELAGTTPATLVPRLRQERP